MITLTLLAIFVTYGYASNEINDFDLNLKDDILFEQFKEVFKKEYKNVEEENMRKEIFVNNLKVIRENNANNPVNTFGINVFSDRKKEELPHIQPLRYNKDNLKNMKKYQPPKMITTDIIPDSYFSCDKKGDDYCGTVISQGICGSCYAASVANEAQIKYAVLTEEEGKKKKEVFSTQQLMDCTIDKF